MNLRLQRPLKHPQRSARMRKPPGSKRCAPRKVVRGTSRRHFPIIFSCPRIPPVIPVTALVHLLFGLDKRFY
jgi:hypothetical protein